MIVFGNHRLAAVYLTATRLSEQTGNSGVDSIRESVLALCATRGHLILTNSLFVQCDGDGEKHLLQAAIIRNQAAILAGRSRNLEILKTLLSTRRFRALAEMREEALSGAIAEGHLDTVKFICDPQWGPMNFISSAHCIEEALTSGAVRSNLVDFSQRLFALLKSRNTTQYPIEIEDLDPNQLLNDISINARQRADIVEYLLHHGAVVQEAGRLGTRYREEFPRRWVPATYDEESLPWNPLRQAVKGGNEKIAKLLLERGAMPDATDNDTLYWAVKAGCFNIVRLLVDHGADVNRTPRWPKELQLQKNPMSPIVEAIRLEHETMARYLHEHGATLTSTLDDVNQDFASEALPQVPKSMCSLTLLLSQCERGDKKCGGPCSWKAKFTPTSPLRSHLSATSLSAQLMGGSNMAGW
ncbi:ankyrin [Lentithecium fluviatile CBS 122367]|uniref:Ankyrin n=1 Tax=Lentithecium fluviatile CBS 122367 TaxID=1168545 RepID=A0A6G1IE24_9PLEO|nr:ankyrin [Lentithecium fluviatile CBS 122367]